MNKAFTLIELLVVVLIIGILSAVALPQYRKAVLKTRFMQLVVWQDALWQAEQVYYLANGAYSSKFDELDVQIPADSITYDENTQYSLVSGKGYSLYLTPGWTQGYMMHGLSYVRAHNNNVRACRSNDNTDLAKAVCLSMGGVLHDCPSCGYTEYYLP